MFLRLTLITFVVGNVIYFFDSISRGANLIDFHGQWAICAHVLRHADPYAAIALEPPLFDDVGVIPNGWGTSPWGCLLGNLFYAGWLRLEPAEVYFFMLNIVLLITTVSIFIARMLSTDSPRGLLIGFALVMISSPNFWLSVFQGNCGAMICCLLLIACLVHREYPILAGVALGIAMIKPQTALIVCFAFLLMRSIRPLIVAAAIDMIAWLITSALIEREPWTVMIEFFSSPIGMGARRGILTLWSDALPSAEWVMPLSMLIGIVFVAVLQLRFEREAELEIFIPSMAAANFWCYAWANERFTLTVLIFFGLLMMARASGAGERLMWLALTACGNFYTTLVIELHDLIEWITPTVDPSTDFTSWHQSITVLELIFILTALALTFKLTSGRLAGR